MPISSPHGPLAASEPGADPWRRLAGTGDGDGPPGGLRRSRTVPHTLLKILKVAAPAVGAAILLTVLIWPHLQPRVDRLRIGDPEPAVADNQEEGMSRAQYTGIDRKGRPFTIVAEMVTRPAPDSPLLHLRAPRADMTLSDGVKISLTADDGVYDREGKSLRLTGHIIMDHGAGYHVTSEEATINLDAGTAAGSAPVQVRGPFGTLDAQGFELEDSGKLITFGGRSKLIVSPGVVESPS